MQWVHAKSEHKELYFFSNLLCVISMDKGDRPRCWADMIDYGAVADTHLQLKLFFFFYELSILQPLYSEC